MKKMFKNSVKKFELNISETDMMSLAIISSAKGITPEMLLECFAGDIVSYFSAFSSGEVSVEENLISKWFSESWFSQDDGYFSFLQYLICRKQYRYVINALGELRKYRIKLSRSKFEEICEKIVKKSVKEIFSKYCTANPAHNPLSAEIRDVINFEKKYRLALKMDHDKFDDMADAVNCTFNYKRAGSGCEHNDNDFNFTALR